MHKLPVNQVLPELKSALQQHNRVILQAPPGAGKTTLVPIALMTESWLKEQQIIMLEPRRLATRLAARRMAQQLGEALGERVGYHIRQDKCFGSNTRIRVVTEGILTRMLQADPALEGIGLIIFDEFHERNLNSDLALAFSLQSQELLNDQLKILLMSATLDVSSIATVLSTNKLTQDKQSVPIIQSQGKSYPVDIIYQQTPLYKHSFKTHSHAVYKQVIHALAVHTGNILVFLPGLKEIRQVEQALLSDLASDPHIIIAPLYGDLSKSQQDQAIALPKAEQRKIVLATNIAETSLTIEGIEVVIDSGLQRESRFNPNSGMNHLETTKIAQDSAQQRCGRAGRIQAGTCYRLWTDSQQQQLAKHQTPEILHSDLAPLLLETAQWGIQDLEELHWLNLPPSGAIEQAKSLLVDLDALDTSGKITAHGSAILSLGIHPRLGHMILRGQSLQVTRTACVIVALLSETDILRSNKSNDATSVDLRLRLTILHQVKKKEPFNSDTVDRNRCRQVLKTVDQLMQRVQSLQTIKAKQNLNSQAINDDMIGVLLAFAYPERIAQQRPQSANKLGSHYQRYLLANGKGAFFADYDSLANEPYLVIANIQLFQDSNKRSEAKIFLAAPISLEQIEDHFSEHITTTTDTTWNIAQQKVECIDRQLLGRLVLSSRVITPDDPQQFFPTLLQGIRSLSLSCLPWSKSALLLKRRLQFLHYQTQHNPACAKLLESIDLPDCSDQALLDNLEQWLLPHLDRQTSIKQLQALDIEQLITSYIDWPVLQSLNKLAPETIQVPSGSNIRIDYNNPQSPVLAVRLQELFGLQQTPEILNGQVPLLLHLLSPAFRPMQVTHDLASFWQSTYHDVKKELRGKYKKHFWPDDPLTASATHRTKPPVKNKNKRSTKK